MRSIGFLIVASGLFLLAAGSKCIAADEKNDASDATPFLTINLVDEAGKPVAGAKVGVLVMLREFDSQTGGNWRFISEIESDSNGVARYQKVLERLKLQPQIYARHGDRQLVGLGDFKVEDFGKGVRLTMRPECHLVLKLDSDELKHHGRKIERPQCIFLKSETHRFWCFPGHDMTAHAFLPSGDYVVAARSPTCSELSMPFTIKPGTRELDIGTLDLPANPLVLLEGKPAPAIEDVIEWKNGPAVTLSELRGKVVLLDFWGWWCESCLDRGIPELFQLQEEFQGKDLVILGIHTPNDEADDIDTVAKLDATLTNVRETVWKGKDIIFPVALIRYRKSRSSARAVEDAPSRICADYGIDSYPTAVLIGRDGNVVGRFDAGKTEDREKLKMLLNDL